MGSAEGLHGQVLLVATRVVLALVPINSSSVNRQRASGLVEMVPVTHSRQLTHIEMISCHHVIEQQMRRTTNGFVGRSVGPSHQEYIYISEYIYFF